jgi:DNA-binding NtrC family response regulator
MGKKHTYATGTDLQRIALRTEDWHPLLRRTQGVQETFIVIALKTTKGNRTRAAEALGIHVNTLGRSIRALGIDISGLQESSAVRLHAMRIAERQKRGCRLAAQ